MKKAKDLTVGETIIDQGRRFIIERICIKSNTLGQIAFIDTAAAGMTGTRWNSISMWPRWPMVIRLSSRRFASHCRVCDNYAKSF